MKYPRISILFLVFALIIAGILPNTCHAAPEDHPAMISSGLLEKALLYVETHKFGGKEGDSSKILLRLEARDVHTLYEVAQAMNSSKIKDEMLASIQIWDSLANSGHLLSQVALGFAFAENDKKRAIKYFIHAGEKGPHQVSLFNAGRLLAEPEIGDYVKSLAYMRAAYDMGKTHPKLSTAHMVETSKIGYERLSEEITDIVVESMTRKGGMISIKHIGEMFLYANLNDFPLPKTRPLKDWHKIMRAMLFNEFEDAHIDFGMFAETHENELSDLQKTIIKALQNYCMAAAMNNEL